MNVAVSQGIAATHETRGFVSSLFRPSQDPFTLAPTSVVGYYDE
jgi:hypothetical protein